MDSCLQELERCLLTRPGESEEKISYTPELRREARRTFQEARGRLPTRQELDAYIESGKEALDFYKIRNACLIG